MIGDYPTQLDEIDQWLFDSFGILPGACSSIEDLRHTTARMVAEALWPKKDTSLTWEDIQKIFRIDLELSDSKALFDKDYCKEVLRRFNEQRKK